MNIFIRVDASFQIGTGHVMRCLTFANNERNMGNIVHFICRKAEGDCINLIKNSGFHVYELPFIEESLWDYTKKNWLTDVEQTINILKEFNVGKVVVDHYSIDEKWENKIRAYTREIFVIDDLANRKHDCDTLLDQNFYLNMQNRYEGLVPNSTELLLGPKYTLLREEFILAREQKKLFTGDIKRIFIFFGGSDPTNETERVIRVIAPLIEQYKIKTDVVVGSSNPNKDAIEQLCSQFKNFNYYCQINNMAQLMAKADLAIGAGGTTTWERAYLSLPSIVIAVAENQIEIANALNEKEIIYFLGLSSEISDAIIINALKEILNNKTMLSKLMNNCKALFM